MKYSSTTDWDKPTVRIQLLTEIKDVLLTKGWTRGNNEHRGRVCLAGARNVVLYGNPNSSNFDTNAYRSSRVLEDAITNHHGKWAGVTAWNDTVAKSKNEVIKMLDQEIARLTEMKDTNEN